MNKKLRATRSRRLNVVSQGKWELGNQTASDKAEDSKQHDCDESKSCQFGKSLFCQTISALMPAAQIVGSKPSKNKSKESFMNIKREKGKPRVQGGLEVLSPVFLMLLSKLSTRCRSKPVSMGSIPKTYGF